VSKSIQFAVTDRQREAIDYYASIKGFHRAPELARHALFQYMARYPLKDAEISGPGPTPEDFAEIEKTVQPLDFGSLSSGVERKSLRSTTERNAYWYLLRKRIFERDGYLCQKCGTDGNGQLHIHHIRKRREGGKDTDDNLVTLCPGCHARAEPRGAGKSFNEIMHDWRDRDQDKKKKAEVQ
jgi:predicted HNH restriction endonuclease